MPKRRPSRTFPRPATVGRITVEQARRAVIAVMLDRGEITPGDADVRLRRVEAEEKRLEEERGRERETAPRNEGLAEPVIVEITPSSPAVPELEDSVTETIEADRPRRRVKRPRTLGRISMEEARRAVISLMLERGEITREDADARLRRVEREEERWRRALQRRTGGAG
ncbi:MAG TPA: hypothetical protein VFQ39_15510 [Longimicrobium sp.]|nr:hypothetical protein [Longimicrobium sp.]